LCQPRVWRLIHGYWGHAWVIPTTLFGDSTGGISLVGAIKNHLNKILSATVWKIDETLASTTKVYTGNISSKSLGQASTFRRLWPISLASCTLNIEKVLNFTAKSSWKMLSGIYIILYAIAKLILLQFHAASAIAPKRAKRARKPLTPPFPFLSRLRSPQSERSEQENPLLPLF
jgi:hypothetical protein